MSYDYQGPASIITASRHLGTQADERLNEHVDVNLTSSGKPTLVRLDFDTPLQWPGNPNFVTVNMPDGTSVSGVIAEIERPADGAGWVTFTVDD
ncbi:hypothetical protein YA0871_24795 [Pseudomonas paralactis]|uniref:Uncharacterized protein n=1 Tax=Pseudomonas paralactis TaxID=1615673 RepID=A0A0R3A9R2_9PSED|nr:MULTISPECIES: hypothetical protein [Pseudomonas]KRP69704.1 hypothetical protein TX23_22725 [Pseudomonas paralactis]MBC3257791.1 hypothetical protein [Pseudomonas paralactis]MBI6635885.1 hypothetical protein [Pseudomonas paralactis]MBJ2220605.1 hypothetical protein [Pseudomonas sp. MF7453]